MTYDPYRAHLDEEVLSADPVELVILLFSRLERAIRQARACLEEGDALGRSQHVSRGIEIVAELVSSLDQQKGGELAANLRRLYQYVVDKLIEGHSAQKDEPFFEAGAVARTLLEAWQEIRRGQSLRGLAALSDSAVNGETPLCSLSFCG